VPTWYYRYVSNPAEVKQIIDERKIQSLNPHTNRLTWYTRARYIDLAQAQRELAMPNRPTHRMGPTDESYLGSLHVSLRLCPPMHGFPGGGVEVATFDVVWLIGLWNFNPGAWDL
jgi:hypothetical protein